MTDLSHREATFSPDKYREWREKELRSQFTQFFSTELLRDKIVLDFGCGTGELSHFVARNGSRRVIGVDLGAEGVRAAIEAADKEGLGCEYVVGTDPKTIPLGSESVDAVLCFDVLEHVMDYREVVREWARVLTPGGRVLIWWSVWWRPYGHHLHTMIPLPWIHTFMSDESMLRVCAWIYGTPEFKPRNWHFDAAGRRKPNPYRGQTKLGDLNKLTIRGFDSVVRQAGLLIARKQVNPFTNTGWPTLNRWLLRSPWPDFFCSCVVCELQRPDGVRRSTGAWRSARSRRLPTGHSARTTIFLMAIHLMHISPTFDPGGAQVRIAILMNHLGADYRHTMVALSGTTSAHHLLRTSVSVEYRDPPPRSGLWNRLASFRDCLRSARPDLLLTYNWGAVEAVAAGRMEGVPCIHAEDGFGPEEATQRKLRRSLFRRILLRGNVRVVVPSRTLLRIAKSEFGVHPSRVEYIPNGIDTARFAPGDSEERRATRQAMAFEPEDIVVGFVGHLRPEKNVGLLLGALAGATQERLRLLVVGQGQCREELESLAQRMGIASRVRFVGAIQDTAPCYRAMDLFCLCSDTEQMPISLLEAMASGLPCLCSDVGDCGHMMDRDSEPFLFARGDGEALRLALDRLAADQELRAREGARLRARCEELYGLDKMVGHYDTLYRSMVRQGVKR